MQFKVDKISGLDSNLIDEAIKEAYTEIKDNLPQEINSNTPVRTGYLKSNNSIKIEGNTFIFENDTNYAQYVYDKKNGQMWVRTVGQIISEQNIQYVIDNKIEEKYK